MTVFGNLKSFYYIFLAATLGFASCNNLCKNVDCGDFGYCYEGECVCEKWHSGLECEDSYNTSVEAVYGGEARNGARLRSEEITLKADPAIPNRLDIEEFGVYLEFETDSTFVIPVQTTEYFVDMTFKIFGHGKLVNQVLEIELGEYDIDQIVDSYTEVNTSLFTFKGDRVAIAED